MREIITPEQKIQRKPEQIVEEQIDLLKKALKRMIREDREREDRFQRAFDRLKAKGELEGQSFSKSKGMELKSREISERIRTTREVCSTGRNLEKITGIHGFKKEELEKMLAGSDVIDVGAGSSTFGDELMNLETPPKSVTVVDSDETALANHSEKVKAVKADATMMGMLPVESADHVFASFSLPLWASSEMEVEHFLRETLLLAKDEGQIHIAPIVGLAAERPSVAKGRQEEAERHYAKLFSEHGDLFANLSIAETDKEIQFMIMKIELRFLSLLSWLKEFGFVELEYKKAEGKDLPTSVSIKRKKSPDQFFEAIQDSYEHRNAMESEYEFLREELSR